MVKTTSETIYFGKIGATHSVKQKLRKVWLIFSEGNMSLGKNGLYSLITKPVLINIVNIPSLQHHFRNLCFTNICNSHIHIGMYGQYSFRAASVFYT